MISYRRRSSSSTTRMTVAPMRVRTASLTRSPQCGLLPDAQPRPNLRPRSGEARQTSQRGAGRPGIAVKGYPSAAGRDGAAVRADACVRRDPAGTVRAPALLAGARDRNGHEKQPNGQGTQHQPGHKTRGHGKTTMFRRNITDGGSEPSPQQESHARLVRWPLGPGINLTLAPSLRHPS